MKVRKQSIIVALSFISFVAFQNCSKVQFAALQGNLSGKASTDGLEDQDFPPDEPLDPSLDQVDNETENSDLSDCQQFAAGQIDPNAKVISQSQVVIHKERGDLIITDSDSLDLSNIRGSVMAKTDAASHLRNMRGSLCLVAADQVAGASLDMLNNHRGSIELIGVHAGILVNTRGTLIVRGGSVDQVRDHRGNIELYDGAQIGSVTDLKDGQVIQH